MYIVECEGLTVAVHKFSKFDMKFTINTWHFPRHVCQTDRNINCKADCHISPIR